MKCLFALKQKGLKPLQVLLVLVVGTIALRIAYLPVVHDMLFFSWTYQVPFFCLGVLTIVYCLLNIRKYLDAKQLLGLTPLTIGIVAILLVVIQQRKRSNWDKAFIIFTASTTQIGNDGGFSLNFKREGIVKATKMDHWSVTYYWGKYRLEKDTVYLDVPLDFELGKIAVLEKDALRFLGDTLVFRVYRFNN